MIDMNSVEWGDIPARIEKVLREFGPMTGQEVGEFMDIDPGIINKTLRRMREPSKRRKPLGVRRVHIIGWTLDVEGQRQYIRAIYALGDGQHKPKPKPKTRAQIVSQQYHRKKAKTRMNFVFNLGGQA